MIIYPIAIIKDLFCFSIFSKKFKNHLYLYYSWSLKASHMPRRPPMVLPANQAKKESAPSDPDTYPLTIAIIIKLFLDIASTISALPD